MQILDSLLLYLALLLIMILYVLKLTNIKYVKSIVVRVTQIDKTNKHKAPSIEADLEKSLLLQLLVKDF